MHISRPWAFWRRAQYAGGLGLFVILILVGVYFVYFQQAPTCFDGRQNGDERGIDCGGACSRVCVADAQEPRVAWAQAFRVTEGMYNAVAYVENRNINVGTPELSYTFSLFDESGALITTRSGTTFLPPDSTYPVFESRIAVGNQVPARTFLEIAPVTNWQNTSITRDQFEVRERTLRSADSAPRLDTRIFNTTLRAVEDVEVVATIFDRSGNALTASQSVVPRFDSRSEASVVFTWPEPIAGTIRSCEVPTDVMLAIDLSGSMNNDGGTPPEPITSVLNAAQTFAAQLQSRDQVGVVTFATQASIENQLSNNTGIIAQNIAALSIDPAEETGSTNTGAAIDASHKELVSARHNENARKVLVLLTDGKATAPDDAPEAFALSQAAEAKADGVEIFTIGLGTDVDRAFLQALASDAEHQFTAISSARIDAIYTSISTALCEDGPAVIEVVVKNPGDLRGAQ